MKHSEKRSRRSTLNRLSSFALRSRHQHYIALASAAALENDRVAMENWYQHAEHYFRVMKERLATMSRYFFRLYTEGSVEQDTVGVEFPSLEAAIEDAEQARRDYLKDEEIKAPRAQRRCRFEITDKDGQVVAMVPPANF